MHLRTWHLILSIAALGCQTSKPNGAVVSSAIDGLKPLEKRNGVNSFCGVEQYREGSGPECGPGVDRLAATSACGVRLFNERQDPSCPGSETEDTKQIYTHGKCGNDAPPLPHCPDGYQQIGSPQGKKSICRSPRRDSEESEAIVQRVRTCRRAEKLLTCRREEFGIESYEACRHPSHGTDFPTCRNEKFGTESYKSCDYYLQPAEISAYIARSEPLISIMGQSLADNRGSFYVTQRDSNGLACTIKSYHSDPLFQNLAARLKLLYVSLAGEEFDPSRDYACAQAVTTIESYSCASTDTSEVCKRWRSYAAAKKWLTVTLLDVSNLLSNDVARADAQVTAQLENLRKKLIDTKVAE
jgi:hypothetical protein